jgi:heme/copper-type cytochrome/quinol oxidase subunit 2
LQRATLVLAGALAFSAAPGRAEHHENAGDTIEVVSTNVQGKNVFIPSSIVVAEGQPHTLSIFNTTDVPHGFAIAGIGVEVVLPPQEETRVELPALEGEKIHRIHCQLHAPHRSAQLVVLDAD